MDRVRDWSQQQPSRWGDMDIDPPRAWGPSTPSAPEPREFSSASDGRPQGPIASTSGSAASTSSSSFVVGPPLPPPVIPSLPTVADAYAAALDASLREQNAAPPPYQRDSSEHPPPREE
jgi:hypothetical protein